MTNTVAVLFGGAGAEHDVSCLSAASVFKHFPKDFCPMPVYIDRAGDFFHYIGDTDGIGTDFSPDPRVLIPTYPVRQSGRSGFLTNGETVFVTAVLPVLHGDFGEDGRIAGALDTARIPYAGAGVADGALAIDKELSKLVAASLGIPTVPGIAVFKKTAGEALALAGSRLGRFGSPFPLFVKPAALGSSVGAGIAGSEEEFRGIYTEAAKYGKVLIERYLPGVRELECAYLAPWGEEAEIVSMPGEIRSKDGFYDYGEKYGGGASVTDTPTLAHGVSDAVRDYTGRLAVKLPSAHLFRADYFLCPDGQIFFNEINTFPGMTEGSLYPRLLGREGICFEAMLSRLIKLARDRCI